MVLKMSGQAGGSQGGGVSSGTAGDCEGEDQEDSSSSPMVTSSAVDELRSENVGNVSQQGNQEMPIMTNDSLSSFRQQWQRELEYSPSKYVTSGAKMVKKIDNNIEVETIEEKAKCLFMSGVEHEQVGKMYEAIQFYRRAVQLVPDIEFRLYETNKNKMAKQPAEIQKDEDDLVHEYGEMMLESEEPDEDISMSAKDLLIKMQRILSRNGSVCSSKNEQRAPHISCLPVELVLYVLRWVVSRELDTASLDRCAAVCRGFYACARDPEIWRMICVKTWGLNIGQLKGSPYSSWRQMYLQRPRLRLNGCYISKTTYLRHGENSFQDQFYRPWYLVEYYRYLRFFPEGLVLMLTTADEPAQCVSLLKTRLTTKTNQGVLSGHYRLHGDKIILVVKKQQTNPNKSLQSTTTRFKARRKDASVEQTLGQTFHLELQIKAHKLNRNYQLVWQGYRVFAKHKSGSETSSSFDLVGTKFPPFWFSRVRSYNAETDFPLV